MIALVSVLLLSCAKSEKERLLAFQKDLFAWYQSPNFMTDLKSSVHTKEQLGKFLESKGLDIAKKHGFNTSKEISDMMKKYEKDPEVEKFGKEMQSSMQKRYMEMLQFMMSLEAPAVLGNPADSSAAAIEQPEAQPKK
jgi:hypothetical protein